MKAAVLHGFVPEGASKDEMDMLVQAEAVSKALRELGHDPIRAIFSIDMKSAMENLRSLAPDFVFNLVESVEGQGRLIYIAPALLDYMKIPYTGSDAAAVFLTTNKIITKERLHDRGIPTPAWINPGKKSARDFKPGPYILKSVWEHASVGLDEDSVIEAKSEKALIAELARRCKAYNDDFFAERYIDGREFNLSIVASGTAPDVLPPVEIIFDNYPAGKNRVVGYRAKWEEGSFEYNHTPRRFDFPKEDRRLSGKLIRLAKRCWNLFGLRGYARVDFRVDNEGKPFVLEINTNPCLSPDAGFAAASARAGLAFSEVIEKIIGHMAAFYNMKL